MLNWANSSAWQQLTAPIKGAEECPRVWVHPAGEVTLWEREPHGWPCRARYLASRETCLHGRVIVCRINEIKLNSAGLRPPPPSCFIQVFKHAALALVSFCPDYPWLAWCVAPAPSFPPSSISASLRAFRQFAIRGFCGCFLRCFVLVWIIVIIFSSYDGLLFGLCLVFCCFDCPGNVLLSASGLFFSGLFSTTLSHRYHGKVYVLPLCLSLPKRIE